MKIIFVIPNMAGGGTERVISLLSDEYIKMGFEVAIMQFAGYKNTYKLNDKVEDFSVALQSKGNPFIMITRLSAMRRYFKNNPDSYIFAFNVTGAVYSVIATFGMKRRILAAERNDPDKCKMKKMRNWAYKHADRITVQTPDGISCFPAWAADKIVVIPNPIDASIPERYTGIRSKSIVTVGRLHEQKNHALLLDAFADFSKQFPEYELHIYGQGELEQILKAQAEGLHINKKVVWHGFCADVREKIRDAAMFVLSSDYEGISNSMLEALAMGIPTISTDCPIGGARIYVTPEESGLLVPVRDKKALAEAMTRVASDEALAEKMSLNAVKVREKYSVETIARQFLKAADIAYSVE